MTPCARQSSAMNSYLESAVEAIGQTPLVELSRITRGLDGRILAKLDHLNPGFSKKDRVARQIIEDDEMPSVRFANVEDSDDVFVFERLDQICLTPEPFDERIVARILRVKNLDRDDHSGRGIERAINSPPASGSYFLDNPVFSN